MDKQFALDILRSFHEENNAIAEYTDPQEYSIKCLQSKLTEALNDTEMLELLEDLIEQLRFIIDVRGRFDFTEADIYFIRHGQEMPIIEESEEDDWADWYTPAAALAEYRKYLANEWSPADAREIMGEACYQRAMSAL